MQTLRRILTCIALLLAAPATAGNLCLAEGASEPTIYFGTQGCQPVPNGSQLNWGEATASYTAGVTQWLPAELRYDVDTPAPAALCGIGASFTYARIPASGPQVSGFTIGNQASTIGGSLSYSDTADTTWAAAACDPAGLGTCNRVVDIDLLGITASDLVAGAELELDAVAGATWTTGSAPISADSSIWLVERRLYELVGGDCVLGTTTSGYLSRHRWRRGAFTDTDDDGFPDSVDTCSLTGSSDGTHAHTCFANEDSDADGYGDVCDFDVNQDGGANLIDVNETLQASRSGLSTPDFDCDGQATLRDVSSVLKASQQVQAPGPSGLACAGTIPCP